MNLVNLKINSFRNLYCKELSFSPGKNLIHGKNGAGKTSVLEAIFMLGFGRSFLKVKKSDLIKFGQKAFSLHAAINGQTGENNLYAHYERRYEMVLNSKKTNLIHINKYLYPVFFSSANFHLQIETIPLLRRVINRFIFGVNPLYMRYILCYNRSLKQKNYLLKSSKNIAGLSSWNKIMSEMAEKIINTRSRFIYNLNQEIKERYGNDLKIQYSPSIGNSNPQSGNTVFQAMENAKSIEIQKGRAQVGPHLDHYRFEYNGKNLKFFSSGEKKINLLMVYIAFVELFKKDKGEYPLFLVDDFDTAIDQDNINLLTKHYPDMQVITTSVNKYSRFDRLIEIIKET